MFIIDLLVGYFVEHSSTNLSGYRLLGTVYVLSGKLLIIRGVCRCIATVCSMILLHILHLLLIH